MLGEVLALLSVTIRIGVLACLACRVLWWFKKRKCSRAPVTWLLLLFFFAAGYGRMALEVAEKPWESHPAVVEEQTVSIRGETARISETEKSCGLWLKNCVMTWQGGEVAMPDILVYVERGQVKRLEPIRIGMEVSAMGKLKRPEKARNPGAFDFRSYYRSQGIWYQMFGTGLSIEDRSFRPYADGIYRLRLAGAALLERICEPGDLGIYQAALLGDRSALEEPVQELYQRNGIAHLLAISGLHISLIGLSCYRMLRMGGLGQGPSGVLGAMVIVSYGLLTGASSSVIRAVAMVLVYMLAEFLGRSYDMLSAAALSALLLLAESPTLVFQAGFQLSFGAVAAIGGLGPWLSRQAPSKSGLAQALVMGASIQLVTYPIILYHFFQYPLYGVFLNLLVIPLMQYVILSGLAGMALGGLHPGLGIMMLGAGHYILEFYQWICGVFDRLPGSNLVIGRPELWQIGAYYLVLGVVLWLPRHRKRTTSRRLGWWAWHLAGGLACFVLLWQLPVRGLEVTFLDVGQGDGICIRTRESVILVDGGSSSQKELGKSRLEPYLKSQGIRQIDVAVVSHGDMDHISGLLYLLEESGGIPVKTLLLPYAGKGDEAYDQLIRLQRERGGRVHWMKEGERLTAEGISMVCLSHGNERKNTDRNEQSLVIQLEYGSFGLLLTGDMSREGELELLAKNSWQKRALQMLKVAHHGSKSSTCQEFLQAIDPEYAVISYEEGNSYGHPHQEVLERLAEQGARVYQTAESGAIIISVEKKGIQVEVMD